MDAGAAVLIRNGKITSLMQISEYVYSGLPMADERGFALLAGSIEEWNAFIEESHNLKEEERAEFQNRWFAFEVFRKIVCKGYP